MHCNHCGGVEPSETWLQNTFEKKIPTRQWCDMCGEICRIIFWVPDDVWLECIPRHHWTSRVCIECFMKRADEKLIQWEKDLKIISMDSLYSQIEVQKNIFQNKG
jgi:hypothetical protein